MYIITPDDIITEQAVLPQLSVKPASCETSDALLETGNFAEARKEFEVKYLKYHLQKNFWNITKVAELLGMQQPNLSRKMKE